MKLRKGDKVKVIKGKDRSREGEITRVLSAKGEVLVSGVNIYRKHAKPSARNKEGGIIEIQKPLPAENVMLLCPQCQQTTRVGCDLEDRSGKSRVCKKCQAKL